MPENKEKEKQKLNNSSNITTLKQGVSFSHPLRFFGFEAFLFSLGLGLGILAALRLKEIFELREIPYPPPSVPVWQFLFYFFIATVAILAVVYFFRFKKGKKIFLKVIFFLAIAFGNLFFFELWLGDYFAFPLVAILIIALLAKPSLIVHNIAFICATAGIGAGLGLRLQPEAVALLLVLLSIYDFIAVYKTKHMVKIAKEMMGSGAILGFVIPQKISDFTANIKKVRPGGRFLILGGGDVVFPLIFAASLISAGLVDAIIVAGFSLLGLFAGFLIFFFQKERKPMPALPPIALFSIIGFIITKLL